jgi:hypothetical protein
MWAHSHFCNVVIATCMLGVHGAERMRTFPSSETALAGTQRPSDGWDGLSATKQTHYGPLHVLSRKLVTQATDRSQDSTMEIPRLPRVEVRVDSVTDSSEI